MGEGILRFFKTKINKEYKIAFTSTFLIAILIHLYKFVNTLPNQDSLHNYYADQNILGSGRWALSWACGISSYYDLPWVIGLLSCVFIALTVVVLVALFRLKNPVLIALSGALLAAAPATTETFFFLYTADGYMIAMFLAALAVYLSRLEEKRYSRFILSGVCICVCCGIYQASVSFALLLAICYFIDALLQNEHSKQDCLKWVLRQAIIFAAALAAYYVIWKLFLRFTGTAANTYQGISDVGKFRPELLISGLISAVKATTLYFIQWNVFERGFSLYSALHVLFLFVMVAGLLIACVRSGILKRKWAVVLLVLCLVAIIPFACIWSFTSDAVGYRAMMLQSLTTLFILTALLYEKWAKTTLKDAVCLFLILIVFNNALIANISYFYLNLCYERTYAEGLEMILEIHDLQDEYQFDKIAVVGTRLDQLLFENYDHETGIMAPAGKLHILSSRFRDSLLYDAEHTTRYLEATFGLKLEPLHYTLRNELHETEQVKAMACWPAAGSMAVLGDTLVIKLSDTIE